MSLVIYCQGINWWGAYKIFTIQKLIYNIIAFHCEAIFVEGKKINSNFLKGKIALQFLPGGHVYRGFSFWNCLLSIM